MLGVKMKIKTMLVTTLMALCAPFAASSAEEPQTHGMVEVMSGEKTSTLDTKVLVPVAPRTSVFHRNRTTTDYQGKISDFHVFKLNYGIVKGLNLTGGVMGNSAQGIKPQLGLEYAKKFGDFKFYQLALASTEEDSVVMSLTNVTYAPKLADGFDLVVGAENVSNVTTEGDHQLSLQRLRAGIGYGKLQAGLGWDLVEKGPKYQFDNQPGVFVKTVF